MTTVRLYGPAWSAYTRTARLTLLEKDVAHDLIDVDFSSGQMPAEQWSRHPFGKVPAFEHNGFALYETSAICRYIDVAFDGPSLQPSSAQGQGRMAQVIALLDNHLSDAIRLGFVNEKLIKPMEGGVVDIARANAAHSLIADGFAALAKCIRDSGYMIDEYVTLADLHAAPLFDYLSLTQGGDDLIASQAKLFNWWSIMKCRPHVVATSPDLQVFKRSG